MTHRPETCRTLLIFDLDGTLYDTRASFLPTMRRVFATADVPYPGDRAVMDRVGEPFAVLLDWLVAQGVSDSPSRLAAQIAQYEYASIQASGILFEGVEATLRELRRRGQTLALCTNGDRPYVDAVLGKFGLLGLFDAIQTHGDAGRSKPQMVEELLDRFGPHRAWVIGDRVHDFEAARATGCHLAAVAYGFADDWQSANADSVLDRFADLLYLFVDASSTAETDRRTSLPPTD